MSKNNELNLFDELLDRAFKRAKDVAISENVSFGSVACALITDDDNIYEGVCLDTASSLGFCAERNAIGTMLTNGETHIKAIVSCTEKGVLYPSCGACRELMWQLPNSGETLVGVGLTRLNEVYYVKLKDLMPYRDSF